MALTLEIMCGIAGVLRRGDPKEDLAAVERMMSAQAHRGPDDASTFHDETIALGHRRLAIIDLSPAGRQPMSNPEESVWVVSNGEIYNFRELRAELERSGYRFRSGSDTEVLIHGYTRWGIEGLLGRLRGMFAFGLYDRRPGEPRRLLLVRDRFGIKPLYYFSTGDVLVFASEVRALLASGIVPDGKSRAALVRFLQLGSLPSPLTTVENVRSVPAGHYLDVIDGRSELKRYWSLGDFMEGTETEADAAATTRELLERAVETHLVSDVPLGVFLSGGIDSSALVALASRRRAAPLTTLSVVFEESEWNEAPYARLVARTYRTDHREVFLREDDFFENLPGVFAAMDQPTVDGVNTYFVAKAAREAGLTVVLSGAGADEVFLGYEHFRRAQTLSKGTKAWSAVPVWARRRVVRAAAAAFGSKLQKLDYLESPSPENFYLVFRGLFSRRQIQALLGVSEKELEGLGSLDGAPRGPLVAALSLLEFEHYLHDQLLKDADFMSMAHAVETRVPYLDHPLVEFVYGLPAALKLGGGKPKALLLDALDGGLPREVWDRKKRGFTLPFQTWLKRRPDEIRARSLERTPLVRKAVEDLWDAFLTDQLHWSRVWALFVVSQFGLE